VSPLKIQGGSGPFHLVSISRETVKLFIGIENYVSVSPFHDFRDMRSGNLI
jgi:hypothetical protein